MAAAFLIKSLPQIYSTSTLSQHFTLREPDLRRRRRREANLCSRPRRWCCRLLSMAFAKRPNNSLAGGLTLKVRVDDLKLWISVLCPNMKQLFGMMAGNSEQSARGRRWKNFLALMGCWWRWAGCCNPGGQISQLSWCSEPCQLDAPRSWEPPGPQGHQPDKGLVAGRLISLYNCLQNRLSLHRQDELYPWERWL